MVFMMVVGALIGGGINPYFGSDAYGIATGNVIMGTFAFWKYFLHNEVINSKN